MATIITREVGATAKGSPLSSAELDNNFINLNADVASRVLSSEKGAANGVATLDEAGKVLSTQLPSLDYIPTGQKGATNGVATLDGAGKVPATQLPSYVDDVLEYINIEGFPVSGETGKIYIALDTNKTYRWSGSVYVSFNSGAVDSVAGKIGIVTLNASDVGLGNVDNKSSSTIRSEITSSNVTDALGYTPQTTLVSGTNIKTVNNQSIVGSGNIEVEAGSTITVSSSIPSNPSTGDTWFYTTTGIKYTYIDDGDSSQWVALETPGSSSFTSSGGTSLPTDSLSPFLLMGA
jgi:hypothetical protein